MYAQRLQQSIQVELSRAAERAANAKGYAIIMHVSCMTFCIHQDKRITANRSNSHERDVKINKRSTKVLNGIEAAKSDSAFGSSRRFQHILI